MSRMEQLSKGWRGSSKKGDEEKKKEEKKGKMKKGPGVRCKD